MDILINYISVVLGALITYWLYNYKQMNVVLASALPSLIISILYEIELLGMDPIVLFYGGSFIGMSSKNYLKPMLIIAAALILGTLFPLISDIKHLIGGTLGTSACMSCIMALTINKSIGLLRDKVSSKN